MSTCRYGLVAIPILHTDNDVQAADGFTKYSSYGEGQFSGGTPPIPLLFYRAGHYDLLIDASSNPLSRM